MVRPLRGTRASLRQCGHSFGCLGLYNIIQVSRGAQRDRAGAVERRQRLGEATEDRTCRRSSSAWWPWRGAGCRAAAACCRWSVAPGGNHHVAQRIVVHAGRQPDAGDGVEPSVHRHTREGGVGRTRSREEAISSTVPTARTLAGTTRADRAQSRSRASPGIGPDRPDVGLISCGRQDDVPAAGARELVPRYGDRRPRQHPGASFASSLHGKIHRHREFESFARQLLRWRREGLRAFQSGDRLLIECRVARALDDPAVDHVPFAVDREGDPGNAGLATPQGTGRIALVALDLLGDADVPGCDRCGAGGALARWRGRRGRRGLRHRLRRLRPSGCRHPPRRRMGQTELRCAMAPTRWAARSISSCRPAMTRSGSTGASMRAASVT